MDISLREPLFRLGLPSQYTVGSDAFVERVIRLLASKRDEKDVVARSFGYFDDPLEAPSAGLRRESGIRIKDVMNFSRE